MELTIERDVLLQLMQTVIGVVEKRQTMPILSNVLLEVEGNQLTISATDLEIELRVSTSGIQSTEGKMTVPARKLFDITRGISEGSTVSLKKEKDKITLKAGQGTFSLSTMEAGDFPIMESPTPEQTINVESKQLLELVNKTMFAMAHQDVRYYLNGLMLELSSNRIRAVATDGHRLALSDAEGQWEIDDARQIIIPRKAIVELSKSLKEEGNCELHLAPNFLGIETGETRFRSKLIDGRFPDYERVIPEEGDKVLEGNRNEIKSALARTAILSNEKFRGIRMLVRDNQLLLQTQNPEHEEAEEIVDVNYIGQELEIGFNVNYLMEALNVLKGETFRMTMSSSDRSGVITDPEDQSSLYVVMPMRL